MNKASETRLAETARTAKNLRECINNADSMLRSWARHKADTVAGLPDRDIYMSMSDRRCARWHTGASMSTEVVQTELVPVLKRIRDNAIAELAALEMPK